MNPELQKRVMTGAIGGTVIILLVTLGGRIGTALFAVGMTLGMLLEYLDMTLALPDKGEKRFVLLGAAWLVAFVNFWIPRAEYELLLIMFLSLFAYFVFTAARYKGDEFRQHFHELAYSLFGTLYLIFLPLFLPLLREYPNGAHWVVLFFLIVWMGDTGAYFAGKKYGRRKLYPVISPKKTWEGAGGGLAASLLVAILYKLIFFRAMPWGALLILPPLVGAVSQIGDLCESFIKRAYERKDSGSILPGHGGFLDRFDGVVFSLPIMYVCVRLFG